MVIAMAAFTVNDALMKSVSAHMNVGQIMAVRGFLATILIAIVAWYHGAFHTARSIVRPWVLFRAVAELGSATTYLLALSNLPMANVSAVFQALPLAATLGAVLFLGETVGWRRWMAIVVGFVGVLIIVRPGLEGFSGFTLFALASVIFAAARDLSTKKIPAEIPSILISLATSVLVTVFGFLAIEPMGGWRPIDQGQLLKLTATAVLLLFAYQFIILAMRTGEMGFVAPFRYASLPWAIFLGYFFFQDIPDVAMLIGSLLIVGSGLYTLYRERVKGPKSIAAETTSPSMGPDGL